MKRMICILTLFAVVASAQFQVSINEGEVVSSGDTVTVKLPFDKEYSINLNNRDEFRRVLVNIRIDGRAVTDDGLILRSGENISLERFIDSGSLTRGQKFLFTEKAEAVKAGRKPNNEDGLVIVTVQYEQAKNIVEYRATRRYTSGCILDSVYHPIYNYLGTTTVGVSCKSSPISDYTEGVTEEGSESRQRFEKAETEELEKQVGTIIIRLVGCYEDNPILVK
jgi:predicted  nucleic acid-binding Zn-ribbon protein